MSDSTHTDDTQERFNLIEMDPLPVKSTATKTASMITKLATVKQETQVVTDSMIEIDAPMDWLTQAKLDIAASTTRDELIAAITPHKARPESERAMLRAFKEWHYAHIQLATLWALIWASFCKGVSERPTLVATPVIMPVVVANDVTTPDVVQSSVEALIADLAIVADNSATNAAVQGIGSMAGGQMAYAGFNSAEGYVRALRNGVKEGTAAMYKQTLRNQYHYTTRQIDDLVVVTIPDGANVKEKAGTGTVNSTTFIPTGPSVFDLPKEQRAFKVGQTTETYQEVQAMLAEGQLIAAALGEGQVLQTSWTGHKQTTVGELTATFAAFGITDVKVPTSSDARYLGAAVKSLGGWGSGYDCNRLSAPKGVTPPVTVDNPSPKPKKISARWMVGVKASGAVETLKPGDAYGATLVVVDLMPDGSLEFGEGANQDLVDRIRDHYNHARANEVLKSDVLTAWFGSILRGKWHSVKRGQNWYVPGGHAAAARRLSEALETLWGSHDRIPVTTGPDLIRSLSAGLTEEVDAVQSDYNAQVVVAGERAVKAYRKQCEKDDTAITADGEKLARDRAILTHGQANALLIDIARVHAKLDGYTVLLGSEVMKPIKAKLVTLRNIVEPLSEVILVELD